MKHLRLIVMATVIIGITWSCQQEEELTPQSDDHTFLSEPEMVGMTKLGKQLENPYSVENMKKALESLKTSNPNGRTSQEEIDITTTHLYIRFKPKDEDELSILKRDSTLVLYDYPLDYEIAETGDFYHDPEVPVDQPTYQYCAVEVGKELPEGVEYELLAELFIPDEDNDDEDANGRITSSDLTDALVDEALRITGNLESKEDGTNARRSKWRPAGRIQVWDDTFARYVGVEGVEVRARRWFTTHEGIVNSQGYYSCNGRFRRDANYKIEWERYHFKIRRDAWNGAKLDGPKKRGSWNLNIRSGAQEYYATIFRAAYHYYYKSIKGLRRPPQNGTSKTQMKIRAYNESNSDSYGNHAPARRFLGLGSAIKIYNPQRESNGLYATTIHELGHASHWGIDHNDYNHANDKVAESWARGVEWELTRMVYSKSIYKGRERSFGDYTLVVADLIDDSNTDDTNNGLGSKASDGDLDQVNGYTIRQIEDALKGQRTWNGWKNNIKSRYNNGTKENLDALFTAWE